MVSDVSVDRKEDFVRNLQKNGLSNGYISRILSVGKAALNRAYRRQEIRNVPYIVTVKSPPPRDRVLTPEETATLFNAIESEHVFMFCLTAFNTLACPVAILELTQFQIRMDDWLIELNPRGREQTKKYRSAVPITRTFFPWLQQLDTEHVVSYKGRRVNSIKTAWRALTDRAGLGRDVIPKTLRHTMATELRKRGVPEWEVSGILGHRYGSRTTKIYAKYAPDYLGKAVKAIDDYFELLAGKVERPLLLTGPTPIRGHNYM